MISRYYNIIEYGIPIIAIICGYIYLFYFNKDPRRKYRSELMKRRTWAERKAAYILTDMKVKFEENYPIGPFFVDFYIPKKKLVIEIDGSVHWDRDEYDDRRSRYIVDLGYSIYRLANRDVNVTNISNILKQK